MAGTTPRRSQRLPHSYTPKMSERKKGLFQNVAKTDVPSRESLTKHRQLPVVDSESDSDDCDLGIMGTLDSSSGDENDHNPTKTPEKSFFRETRLQSKRLLKQNSDLKNFIKSPFTLNKYQTRYSVSTPATPHLHNQPGTPSSTHSCTSIHTNSSTSSRARKSLASLIAETESCSSSLKDLNFDTDSSADSKENTPTKSIRRSTRNRKMTPKFQSFKGILVEQKKNVTPMKNAFVCLTKMDMSSLIPSSQIMKTPDNTSDTNTSPPKLTHNRKSVVEVNESPESTCDSDISHKRLRNDSTSEKGPNAKYPRLDTTTAPKARVSLFNSDRLKEILSTKSFYGKTNPELNTSVTMKISHAIEAAGTHHGGSFSHSHPRRKRKPGQINMGVRHKIRKPKINKNATVFMRSSNKKTEIENPSNAPNDIISEHDNSKNNSLVQSQNLSQELDLDKQDPFDKEKQTIEALLSQWTEEEVPESELVYSKTRTPELACFNSTVMEATSEIFEPTQAVPVQTPNINPMMSADTVLVELGSEKTDAHGTSNATELIHDVVMQEGHAASHGEAPMTGEFLPVEGGYIVVNGNEMPDQEDLTDLDAIERELRTLDEQILKMAEKNNINAQAVLESAAAEIAVEAVNGDTTPSKSVEDNEGAKDSPQKLFPIFENPNPGTSAPSTKGGASAEKSKKRLILKTGSDQYVIDAGQKRFGATQCAECGVIYQIGDPQDEHDHLIHHNATNILRFNGWKEEHVAGAWGAARCVRVRGGAAGWRRVRALLARVVHPQLGYAPDLPTADERRYTAYLYIEKRQIVGCAVVEPRAAAHRLLPGEPDRCSVEEYPVKCGVSRLWTHALHRRRGVAGRLLECVRASFLYGGALARDQLAFSAPTPAGKAFATRYCGTPNFYVYLQ